MSDVDSTDAKFAMLNEQIGKKFYTDGYRPTLDDASVLLGGATMLAGLFQAERDRLRADHDHLVKINAALRTRPDLAERAPLVVELFADRDRLRAIVRRAQEAWTRHVENYGDDDAFNEWMAAWDALRALDVSGEATDG